TLKEYIIKDFVLDDEKLKQGNKVFDKDYFDELLERIREIRASERRFYQRITDAYSLSADYESDRIMRISCIFKRILPLHTKVHTRSGENNMYLIKNSKSPNYQIVYFIDGKRTTVSTKTSSEREAKNFFKTFKNSIRQPKETQEKPKSESLPSITLVKFKEEYLQFTEPIKSEDYFRSIKLSFRRLEDSIGNIPISKIDVRAIDKFITSSFTRTKRGTHLYFRTLKAAFSKAVSWDLIQDNPFKKIKFPRIPKSLPVFISKEEFKIIVSVTNENFLKDLFTTAFNTGMRLGELVNMQWDWVDLNENTILVKCSDGFNPKNKKERVIPINVTLKNCLLSQMLQSGKIEDGGYVFTNKIGLQLHKDFVSKNFKKAVRSVGMNEAVHFHTLRHSFASRLVQKGVSLYVIKELLGHEDLATTQIYSHLQSQNLRDAVNLL
ncbi:MAG: tyrosine-type recombinase/integrase, partial [Bacteroidetes bacterium]|nr:tyrosine-type recombinase/integrase [Bacteroidota bacterium]